MRGAVEEVAYGTLSDDLIERIKTLGAE
jgi:hypothetical protein